MSRAKNPKYESMSLEELKANMEKGRWWLLPQPIFPGRGFMTVITIRYTIIQASRGVVFTEILTPEYVPERLTDRETLWNEVEHVERNNRAQLAYSFDIALQNELTLEENIRLAKEFCQEQFVVRGMIVDLAVYEGKSDNEEEFVKKVQSCADIARRDREMAEADTSGRSEEKLDAQSQQWIEDISEYADIKELDGNLLNRLISKIVISEPQEKDGTENYRRTPEMVTMEIHFNLKPIPEFGTIERGSGSHK